MINWEIQSKGSFKIEPNFHLRILFIIKILIAVFRVKRRCGEVVREHQQKAFVMLSTFWLLRGWWGRRKQPEIKGLWWLYLLSFYKNYLQNLKFNVKRACIFHLTLPGILSILILSVKNRLGGGGGVGLTARQNPFAKHDKSDLFYLSSTVTNTWFLALYSRFCLIVAINLPHWMPWLPAWRSF